MHTNSYIQSGRTVTEVRYAHQQLYTARQICNREEVCIPTVIQSGRTVTERRCAHQQLYIVRQNCQEVCAPTVIHR